MYCRPLTTVNATAGAIGCVDNVADDCGIKYLRTTRAAHGDEGNASTTAICHVA